MREVLQGVFHWRTTHPRIRVEVDSYWLDDEGVLIDPLVPADVGLEWFAARPRPPRVALLSNRHHHHLLLAHGGPLIEDGRGRLQELVDCGGRTAFELQ